MKSSFCLRSDVLANKRNTRQKITQNSDKISPATRAKAVHKLLVISQNVAEKLLEKSESC